jgi:hypothetical protein
MQEDERKDDVQMWQSDAGMTDRRIKTQMQNSWDSHSPNLMNDSAPGFWLTALGTRIDLGSSSSDNVSDRTFESCSIP